MNASTRILRTCGQVLAALVTVIPAVVAAAHALGFELNTAALTAIGAAAVAVVAAVQNGLESAGKIPVLGADARPVRDWGNGGPPAPADPSHRSLVTLPPTDPPATPVPALGGDVAEANASPTVATTNTPAPAGLSGPARRILADPTITGPDHG